MQKARRHNKKLLRPLVGARFQGLFHSSIRSAFHLSFTVLVRYRSLGSIQPYRMVPAGSRRIPRAPRYSGYHYASSDLVYRTVTVYGRTFQIVPLIRVLARAWSYNPIHAVTWMVWANPRSLATTRGIISYFLFLQVLRCFSSLRQPLALQDNWSSTNWVVPFGNPRIKGYLHLPAAYRSLSRPSSPPRAKASAMRPYLLSYITE